MKELMEKRVELMDQMNAIVTAAETETRSLTAEEAEKFDACKAEITTWGRADLKDVDDSNIGLAGSPTKIAKASDKVRKGAGEKVVPDSPEDAVSYIVGKLKEKHVI